MNLSFATLRAVLAILLSVAGAAGWIYYEIRGSRAAVTVQADSGIKIVKSLLPNGRESLVCMPVKRANVQAGRDTTGTPASGRPSRS